MLESIFAKESLQIRVRTWGRNSLIDRDNVAPNAKTSEWERAGHKGGRGHPRDLRPGFLEKAWIPARDRETTPQVWTCDGPSLNHLPRGHP